MLLSWFWESRQEPQSAGPGISSFSSAFGGLPPTSPLLPSSQGPLPYFRPSSLSVSLCLLPGCAALSPGPGAWATVRAWSSALCPKPSEWDRLAPPPPEAPQSPSAFSFPCGTPHRLLTFITHIIAVEDDIARGPGTKMSRGPNSYRALRGAVRKGFLEKGAWGRAEQGGGFAGSVREASWVGKRWRGACL